VRHGDMLPRAGAGSRASREGSGPHCWGGARAASLGRGRGRAARGAGDAQGRAQGGEREREGEGSSPWGSKIRR
jgi:hypothetical protein